MNWLNTPKALLLLALLSVFACNTKQAESTDSTAMHTINPTEETTPTPESTTLPADSLANYNVALEEISTEPTPEPKTPTPKTEKVAVQPQKFTFTLDMGGTQKEYDMTIAEIKNLEQTDKKFSYYFHKNLKGELGEAYALSDKAERDLAEAKSKAELEAAKKRAEAAKEFAAVGGGQ